MQAPRLRPPIDAPPTLERAWLAAHAWSVLVRRMSRPRGISAQFGTTAVSVTLVRQIALRHAACALEDLRGQVRTLCIVHGMTPTAQRSLMRVHCDLDTSATALTLALRLTNRSTVSDTGSAVPHRKWSPRPVPPVPGMDRVDI
jgi:hypothetical protein